MHLYDSYIASQDIAEKMYGIFETEKPSFDTIALLMTYVFGDVLIKGDNKPMGTNKLLWVILKNGAPGDWKEQTAHVRDVADPHLRALNAFVKGNQRVLIVDNSTKFENVFQLVKKESPNDTWDFGVLIPNVIAEVQNRSCGLNLDLSRVLF